MNANPRKGPIGPKGPIGDIFEKGRHFLERETCWERGDIFRKKKVTFLKKGYIFDKKRDTFLKR